MKTQTIEFMLNTPNIPSMNDIDSILKDHHVVLLGEPDVKNYSRSGYHPLGELIEVTLAKAESGIWGAVTAKNHYNGRLVATSIAHDLECRYTQ